MKARVEPIMPRPNKPSSAIPNCHADGNKCLATERAVCGAYLPFSSVARKSPQVPRQTGGESPAQNACDQAIYGVRTGSLKLARDVVASFIDWLAQFSARKTDTGRRLSQRLRTTIAKIRAGQIAGVTVATYEIRIESCCYLVGAAVICKIEHGFLFPICLIIFRHRAANESPAARLFKFA